MKGSNIGIDTARLRGRIKEPRLWLFDDAFSKATNLGVHVGKQQRLKGDADFL